MQRFITTTVGQKILMAVTGLLLFAFLIVHLVGNLKILEGREALNAYAAYLKASPILWPARLGLLALFAIHIGVAISLYRRRARAVPGRYLGAAPARRRTSGWSMLATGIMISAFAVFHLLHFTIGAVSPSTANLYDATGRHDVFGMVVADFQNLWIAATYVVAMVFLAAHLLHGARSMLATLGVGPSRIGRSLAGVSVGAAALLAAGNAFLPLAVYFGILGAEEVPS